MKSTTKPYLCLFILTMCAILSAALPANAITIEELADTCQKMEKAYQDITIEYERAVEPAPTIEDLKKDDMSGFIITIGPTKCTFATKLPFEERILFKSVGTYMNEQGKSFQSIRIDSDNGKVAKHFNKGGITSKGEQVEVSLGSITESKKLNILENLEPLRFTIFNFKYFEAEKTLLSELLHKKEFVRLVDSVEKVNDFNAIRVELLWDAPNIPILHKKEPQFRVYFSINHGYTPVKFEYLNYTGTKSEPKYVTSVTSLEKVADGLWFPNQGYFKMIEENLTNTYKATKIAVNQGLTDKDFDIKFPPGTRVTDEITGIDYVQTENEMKSLAGKSLPDLSSFGITLEKKEIENKRILVCFFDIDQRPSRNCIQELIKKIEDLKQKNIVVIAIQASKTDKNSFNDWIKEYNINIPLGFIEDNSEKTRFNWGVKALPWLILTDKEHIVTSEGFSINELSEKIKEVEDAKH